MAGINRTTDKATDLITFSRASVGAALRKISYGSELVTNGTFDTASDWSAGGGWSIGSGVASTTSAGNLNQPTFVASVRSKVVKVSYDIVSTMSGSVAPYFQQVAPTVITRRGTYRSAIGSYTDYIVVPENASVFGFNTNATAGSIDNISVKEVLFDQPDGTLTLFNHPNDTPRIEYDAAGNVKGLLIEEARTNLVTYSEDFTNASWLTGGLNSVVSSNTSISPDGNTNAETLSVDSVGGTTGTVGVAKAITVSTSTAYTASVFAKADQSDFLALGVVSLTTPANGNVWFDLVNGSVGTSDTGLSGTIKDFGDGWYRCSITFTTDAADTSGQLRIYLGNTDGGASITRDGTSSILIYGAQLEVGSFPTSYIPTSGATATRSADIASISVDNFGYNQKAGTFVADYTPVSKQNQYALAAATPSGASEYLALLWGNSGNEVRFQVTSGGATSAQLNTQVGTVAGARTIHAGAYKTNDFAACNNGGSVLTDTVGDAPSGLTIVRIGEEFGNYLNGHIKSIAYYPRRLSNAQLQELTA